MVWTDAAGVAHLAFGFGKAIGESEMVAAVGVSSQTVDDKRYSYPGRSLRSGLR